MTESELKPCPFCGNKKLRFSRDINLVPEAVLCNNCGAFVRFLTGRRKYDKPRTFAEMQAQIGERFNTRYQPEEGIK